MGKYIGRRILTGILTVVIVFTLNFMIINLAPGDPIKTIMGKETDDQELRAALEEKYGLNKPLPVQYVNYLKTVVKGDLGTSIIYNRPVSKMIVEKLPATILLVLTAGILSLIIGTAMGGIIAARREGSAIDIIFRIFIYIEFYAFVLAWTNVNNYFFLLN